ncbi:MAG: AhpC/TSA family protein [Chitinophagia bacterium]|nr:AhpC/TSA family protein [Chitinophagia bacterium]
MAQMRYLRGSTSLNNMKKILCFSVLLFAVFQVHAQEKFTIKGDVSKVSMPIAKVYLNYYADGKSTMDSSDVVDGKYSFSGSLGDPLMASLRAKYQEDPNAKTIRAISYNRDIKQLFIENAKISVVSTDSFANATIKGSKSHAEFVKWDNLMKPENQKGGELNKEYSELYKKKDQAGMDRIEAEFDKLTASKNVKNKQYLAENPSSPIAMFIFRQWAGYDINADEAEPIFLSLSEKLRSGPAGKEMAEKIEIAKKTGVGRMAMDFTQNDTLGNPVSLSSFKGKHVLIDFWASWCGPCRQENPNVVKAFNNYKDKGFTVLGVSLDQPNAKDKWMKAIHDDKLTWTHVSDLKYWKNEVAVQYGIQAIPQNYLIDPQGKIIGKNLRGEALNKKLEELFK